MPPKRSYWLVKSEPDEFSYADLVAARGSTTLWDGVRNYQARNTLRDTDESFDYARAKIKLAQMMGVVFSRLADGPLGQVVANEIADNGENDPDGDDPRYDVDLDGGIFGIDIDRGDDV